MIQLNIEMTAVISIRMEHNYNDEREKKKQKKQQLCVQVKCKACETGAHNAA